MVIKRKLNDTGYGLRRTYFFENRCKCLNRYKHKCPKSKCLIQNYKNDDLFKKLSKMEWARMAAATATKEFPQRIQGPSSMHPGTTYPVRATP